MKEGFAVIITYDVHPLRPETGIGPWIRRGLLLWLVAVTVEYMLLQPELRGLAQLRGIAQMNPVRMVLVATGAGAILYLLRKYLTAGTERILLAVAYTVLSVLVLLASFTLPFFFGIMQKL